MTSIVVAYEDDYCEKLHRLVKTLRRDRSLAGIVLEPRPVKGTGNFVGEVPRLLRTRLAQTKEPPDLVVCVGDADRPANLVPGAASAPTEDDVGALEAWVIDFEKKWRDRLIRDCELVDDQSSRLATLCIRWNKESLLISCPDALLGHVEASRSKVAAVLDACDPRPSTLGDADFVTRYRQPAACLDRVFDAMSARRYKKGRDDEDLLEKICNSETHRGQVLRRCPDLGRLVELLAL